MEINQYPDWKHFSKRASGVIDHIIVHSFALSIEEMISILNKYKLAPHYMIDTEGNIIQFVTEDKLAYHAGKSYWKGIENLNETSIGIELQNMTLGQTSYSEKQLYSFKKLAENIIKKYNIQPYNIIGHSDIAPTRKVDPGRSFPWSDMAKHGIGLWTDNVIKNKNVNIKSLLQQIGYDVSNERAALYAFIRHFIPSEIPTDEDIYAMEENLLQNAERYHINNDLILGRLASVAELYKKHRMHFGS